MRIRKNVSLSSFMPAEFIKPYDCQLNQSPWDVIDFSEETETTLHKFENFIEEDGGLGKFNGDVGGSGTSLNLLKLAEDMDLGKTDDIIEKMEATGRRSRCRGTKGMGSNQDQFYYYSGFGPSWGKRPSADEAQGNNNVIVIIDDDDDDEEQNQINDTHNDNGIDENGSKKRKKSVKARSLQSLM